jgi:hypothetical protein
MRNFTSLNPLKRAFFFCLMLCSALISAYALQGPPSGHGRHGDNHTGNDTLYSDSLRHHHHIYSDSDSLVSHHDSIRWGDVTIDLAHDSDSICLDSDYVCDGNFHLKKGVLKLNHHKLKINGNCTADSGTIECDSLSSIEVNGNDSIIKLHFGHGHGHHLGKLKINHCDTTVIDGDVVITDSVEVTSGVLDISSATFTVQGVLSMVNSMMAVDKRTTFTWHGTNKPDTLRFVHGKDTVGTFKVDHSNFPLVVSTNLRVADSLCLNNNKLHIRTGVLSLDSSCVLKGFNRNSYIITGDSGSLQRHVRGLGKEIEFPIGTVNNYAPACITPTKGKDSIAYKVSAAYGVLSKGLTGDSLSGSLVKTTWHVTCNADSFKLTLKLKWPKNLETPGFNRVKCFISHYEHHRWDSIPSTVADSASDSTLVSSTRTEIQSLSPFTVMTAKTVTSLVSTIQNKVIVYPNPTTDFVNFSSVEAGSKLFLVDLTGRIQRNLTLNTDNSTVNVSDLPAGLYLYRIVSDGKVAATGKLAVSK